MKMQVEIPGTERDVIPELEEVCAQLVAVRDQKRELTQAEKKAEAAVQAELRAVGSDAYIYVDGDRRLMVTRTTSEKVKIERLDPVPKPRRDAGFD